jgi:hypothetical protein
MRASEPMPVVSVVVPVHNGGGVRPPFTTLQRKVVSAGLTPTCPTDVPTCDVVDYAIVHSDYERRFHWQRIGLASLKLPPVVDPGRVNVSGTLRVPSAIGTRSVPDTLGGPLGGPRQCVTFVTPEPRKGVHVFARIASGGEGPCRARPGRCRTGQPR